MIDQLNRYLDRMADVGVPDHGDRFGLVQSGSAVWSVDLLVVSGREHLALEASFAWFVSEVRRSMPAVPFALELEVPYPPFHANEYPALFQVPVRYGSRWNALRIDPVWLTENSDFEPGRKYVFGVVTKHADGLLETLKRSHSLHDRIEATVLPDLHDGGMSMDRVARSLGTNHQILYRRLRDGGVIFAEIHDGLRRRMALDDLSARKASVNEPVNLLGFSEASSFVRALRRWTGQSPTAWSDSPA